MKFSTTAPAVGLLFAIALAAAQSAHAQDNPYISPTMERVPYGMNSGWSSWEDGLSSNARDVTRAQL